MTNSKLITIADLGKLSTFVPDDPALANPPLYSFYNPRTATPTERVVWFNALTCDQVAIPSCPEYFVDKFSNLFQMRKGVLVVIDKSHSQGRDKVGLRRADGTQLSMPYQAVYEAFVGELVRGAVIDHINDDSLCDSAYNLQALTQSENRRKSKAQRRARSAFLVVSPDGTHTPYAGSSAASKALGVVPKRIRDAADNNTPLRTGHRVTRIA